MRERIVGERGEFKFLPKWRFLPLRGRKGEKNGLGRVWAEFELKPVARTRVHK